MIIITNRGVSDALKKRGLTRTPTHCVDEGRKVKRLDFRLWYDGGGVAAPAGVPLTFRYPALLAARFFFGFFLPRGLFLNAVMWYTCG